MTFKPGDRVREAFRPFIGTVLSIVRDFYGAECVSVAVDSPAHVRLFGPDALEPLPAKPEDVRLVLVEILLSKSDVFSQADAILAKFPKMLEGT